MNERQLQQDMSIEGSGQSIIVITEFEFRFEIKMVPQCDGGSTSELRTTGILTEVMGST